MRMTDRPALPDSGAGVYDKSATDYLQIRDYLRIVYRRRWMFVAILVVGLLCGMLLNWMTAPIFEAQATLQIDMDLNVLGVDRPLVPLDQRDWMREFLPTQLGILQSRNLARLAHDELTRADRSRPAGNNLASTSNAPTTVESPDLGTTRVPTVDEIVRGRTVSLVRDSRLVNVGFRTTDPSLSAQVANALARAYLQQNSEFRSRTSGDASDWLTKQVGELRKLVEESETALQRYRTQHGADALITDRLGTEQQNVVVQKLAALQAAETRARTETIEKRAQYNQLVAARSNREPLDTVPAIASNAYIQGLKVELATLQRQLMQASNELGERHPEIIKLTGAVQNAERKVQTEISNAARAIENDFEAAQSRERQLVADLGRQKLEVQSLNGKAVEYTALEREATSNREVLDRLLQRSRETALTRELQPTNIRVLDWAEAPRLPILPRKQRNMLIALFGSGGLALGLIFVLEIFNTRITSPEDVKQHLRLRVLGVVPRVKAKNGRASLLLGNAVPAQFAEMLRGVRTNLVLAPELGTGHTLLVTSSEPAEGKTTSAANIAVSLARLNQRVLLIDADLRKPRLHEMFGEDQQPGLADVLAGKTSSRDFRKTKFSGLWLMAAGSASRNPADLLGSPRFSKLVEELRAHFDWIVLDSSPVLAVADACMIARVASGVLLVVDCGRTPREVATAAVQRLEAVRAPILGAMLNRVVLDARGESYLPYYHRSYQTYYPQDENSLRSSELPPAPSEG
jgi:capsular exopolysaccharide synthesis family protein